MRIGIDLGGTKIEGIAMDDAGRERARRRVPTPRGDYRATVEAIVSLIAALESQSGAGASVGIGIPGAISHVSGLVKNANSTCLIGRPLKGELEAALGRSVRLANDANCFALSEAVAGDDLPLRPCYCGRAGCIETYLCGPALERDGGAADEGAIARYEARLARALAGVINLLDPDVIVLGGGVSNVDRLYANVPRLWSAHVFSDHVATRLARHVHGDSSGVRGAAWLWGGPPGP
jgi:fructokinase